MVAFSAGTSTGNSNRYTHPVCRDKSGIPYWARILRFRMVESGRNLGRPLSTVDFRPTIMTYLAGPANVALPVAL